MHKYPELLFLLVKKLYGSRARLGLVVPASNAVAEEEFHHMPPAGVSVNTARMRSSGFEAKGLKEMMDNAIFAAEDLATVRLKALGLACTSAGAAKGYVGDVEFSRAIQKKIGVPTVSAAEAVVEALRSLGVTRLAVATPFSEFQTDATKKYLADAGFEIVKTSGLGLSKGISDLPPESAYDATRGVDVPSAEALLISATGWRSIEVIERLESERNKPVVSSNTALLFAMLRRAGIPDELTGFGTLLSRRQRLGLRV